MPLDPSVDNLDFAVVDHLHWNAVQLDEHGGKLSACATETKSYA